MANQYYRYNGEHTDIALWAIDGMPNNIVIGLYDKKDMKWVDMLLTEQEQNDLIAGILERRGIKLVKMEISEEWVEIPVTPISATGNTQSSIHPADK